MDQLLLATQALLVGAFVFVAWGGHRLLTRLLSEPSGFFCEPQSDREAAFLRQYELSFLDLAHGSDDEEPGYWLDDPHARRGFL